MPHPFLTVTTPSRNWTPAMEMLRKQCLSLGIPYVWVRHAGGNNKVKPILNTELSNMYSIMVVDVQAETGHPGFVWGAIKYLSSIKPVDWILRFDDDELISTVDLRSLHEQIASLNPRDAFGINRLWVRRTEEGNWEYSNVSVSRTSPHDYQYRLVNFNHTSPETIIHSSGFITRKKVKIGIHAVMYHLIWVNEDLVQRIEKIRKYESTEKGAGTSKIRYYLPELYPDNQHRWTEVVPEGKEILDNWFFDRK